MSKANVVGVGIGLRHAGGKRTNDLGLVSWCGTKFRQSYCRRKI